MTATKTPGTNLVAETLRRYLRQLAPHVKEREAALLLVQAAGEIERLERELSHADAAGYARGLNVLRECGIAVNWIAEGHEITPTMKAQAAIVLKHIRELLHSALKPAQGKEG